MFIGNGSNNDLSWILSEKITFDENKDATSLTH